MYARVSCVCIVFPMFYVYASTRCTLGFYYAYMLSLCPVVLLAVPGNFPHPLRGVNTPNFCTTPPGFRKKGGREGKEREGKGKGRGEGKGRDPQGLVDTPTFQILKNTLPCPVVCTDVPGQYRHFYSLQTNTELFYYCLLVLFF